MRIEQMERLYPSFCNSDHPPVSGFRQPCSEQYSLTYRGSDVVSEWFGTISLYEAQSPPRSQYRLHLYEFNPFL